MSMQGSAMMYVTTPSVPRRRRAKREVPSAPRRAAGARSTSADLTTTWSKPAVWARCKPDLSVWFVKPTIGTSGQASTTSSGSTRAMSAMTRSGASMESVVTTWWSGSRASSFAAEEQIDPREQDRRHARIYHPGCERSRCVRELRARHRADPGRRLLRRARGARGRLARGTAGRAGLPAGPRARRGRLVPGRRGNRVGCERQLAKARRRLGAVRAGASRARRRRRPRLGRRGGRSRRFGLCAAAARASRPPTVSSRARLEEAVEVDAEPPEAVEEEQRPERHEQRAAHDLDRPCSGRGCSGRRPSPARRAPRRAGTAPRARARRRRAGATPRRPCRSRRRARGSSRAPGRCTAPRRRRTRRRAGTTSRAGARPARGPAPTSRSGHGSSPMKTSPKTIRTKPAICSSRNWFSANERPIAPRPRRAGRRPRRARRRRAGSRRRRAARPPARPAGQPRRDETADR